MLLSPNRILSSPPLPISNIPRFFFFHPNS